MQSAIVYARDSINQMETKEQRLKRQSDSYKAMVQGFNKVLSYRKTKVISLKEYGSTMPPLNLADIIQDRVNREAMADGFEGVVVQ